MKQYKEITKHTFKIGSVYEKIGKNPFDDESWVLRETRADNTGKLLWLKLEQVEDERNSLTIREDEFMSNFMIITGRKPTNLFVG